MNGKEGTDHIGNVMGDDELAESSGSLSMDDSFGDALSIEMCEEVDEMEVL